MKKIIISIFGIASIFGAVSFASAQSVFNSPAAMPTLTVTNHSANPCSMGPVNGCWQQSTSAQPGDVIAVQVFYHNTSNTPSQGTTLSIKPGSTGTTSSVTFTGGVASLTGPRAVGNAHVSISGSAPVSYISGSARWYPNAGSSGQSVNESGLFGSSGFNIGTVMPGQQGVLVANFKVGSGYNPGPIDDNDCRINSFTADDYTIDEDESTRLRWSTTGCVEAKINQGIGNVNLDGSYTVSPNHNTKYTLTAYDHNGHTVSRSVTIDVEEEEDECSIDSFTADDYNIRRGESTTLRWKTTGVDSVDITPGYNNRSEDGSVNVSPSSTTTYKLYADCVDGGDKTRTVTVSVESQAISSRPQAITTTATVLGTTAARLNGIAVPNTTEGNTIAWFEWGPSQGLGFKTSVQNVPSNNTSNYYSDAVQGLVPGTSYYYRAAVQNQNGIAYGDTVRFQTQRQTTVVTQPPRVIVQPPRVISNVVVAESAPSLLELRVETIYDRMCINGMMDYTVTYRNVSGQVLENAVLQFVHPKEISYISASQGSYEVVDRTITLSLGDIRPGEEGTIVIRARVNDLAVNGNLTVTTATVVYTNTITHAQEDAIAYSLITVSEDCPNLLGASVFGFGSFLPDTLLEWLLLILIILALIVLGRQLYKKEKPA